MIEAVLGYLELNLNEGKTKAVDAGKEGFTFLGFATKLVKSSKTGREFPLIKPSKKAIEHIKAEIKALTCRRNLGLHKIPTTAACTQAVKASGRRCWDSPA